MRGRIGSGASLSRGVRVPFYWSGVVHGGQGVASALGSGGACHWRVLWCGNVSLALARVLEARLAREGSVWSSGW